ncbi:hypothetical protein AKJ09_04470 [Labilithrix luteola]|uniref:RNA polymerase sigma factor RpoE n=1 Tax=Labilithrix luteola TaxID=1391654 RepID=A0A0K1PWQ7_9BACT|nr:sigma-70 family RNA polymerase sigma factor [Labilithrix luteola]AKU97806.1 hypothetical protein AKJ09_04470 [Labilithrix luteola]
MLISSAASVAASSAESDRNAQADSAIRAVPADAAAREPERSESLHRLVREHFSAVWRFLRRLGFDRHLADDAAQDLFFVALRRIDGVTPGRERAFLLGAALRIAVRMKRRGAREIPVDLRDAELDETAATPEEHLDDERARKVLYQLLSELDERFRVVFVMYELEGMTMQEIAEALEIPSGTVASRLRTARDDFRFRLERYRALAREKEGL